MDLIEMPNATDFMSEVGSAIDRFEDKCPKSMMASILRMLAIELEVDCVSQECD